MLKKINVLILTISLFTGITYASTIILNNGDTFEGNIVERTKDKITINVRGIEKEFNASEISKIKGRRAVASKKNLEENIPEAAELQKTTKPIAKEKPSVKINPNLELTFQNALRNAASGNFDTAKIIFKELQKTEQDNVNVIQSLNIIEDLDIKIISDEYAKALFSGAYLYYIEDYDNAIKSLQKALQLRPESSEIYYNLSSIYQALNDYTNAIIYLKKLYELTPADPDVVFDLGCCYYLKEDFKNAIIYLKKATTIIPDDPYIYTLLGMSYYMVDNRKDAKDILKLACAFYEKGNNLKESEKIKKFIATIL
ncbi:MAG: tetratricopeptide repeat protein [Candidatus Omnitrophica bacterium]|nr:tetratricopeptide repeat protein [Candidatus Omnitrophota bacterium]MDD5080972.1 tetratricopeptide repeat protein [Candidatus Omnitrophota bacterium]MDD5440615.1 tetratricopeptide repeat protein [Candidatus Omnitrophota bacterium]